MTILPLLFAATLAAQPLKVSIFSCHIETIAQQEKIPFAEAAQRVRNLGYDGIDIEEGFPSEHLAVAKSLGFVFPCVIGHLAFEREYDAEHCARLRALALSNGCRRVMLVPGFYPKNADRAEVFKTIVARTNRFAAEAAADGLETLVEDFDNERAPTCGRAALSAFLTAAPGIGFVYDTGNFNSPGERAESGLEWLPRVRHFHLKDRPSMGSTASVAVGTGVMPIRTIIATAREAGYSEWFTVEHFGVTNMMDCTTQSIRFLKSEN